MIRQWKTNFARYRSEIRDRYAHDRPLAWRDRFWLAVATTFGVIKESDIMTRSSALSYTVVFSLVPLVTTSIAFLTAFPGLQNERQRLMDALSSQLLPSAVQNVQSYIARFSDRAAAAGAVSSLVFFVIVLMLFEAMESAFNRIWRVKKARSRGERLRTLALFLITGAIATSLFFIIQRKTAELIDSSVILTNLLVAWALFTVAYRVLPNTKVHWRSAFFAGVIVGTIWHFLKSAFTWYVNQYASYESIYGALGTIPVFFLWVYLSFLLLLGGGYVSLVAQEMKTLVLEKRSEIQGHHRAYYAVSVAAVLARAFHNSEAPLSAQQIAERLEIPVYFVNEALVSLCGSGFAVCVTETKPDTYILAKPSHSVSVSQIIGRVAGDPYSIPDPQPAGQAHSNVKRVFTDARARNSAQLKNITIADIAAEPPGKGIELAS